MLQKAMYHVKSSVYLSTLLLLVVSVVMKMLTNILDDVASIFRVDGGITFLQNIFVQYYMVSQLIDHY